MCFTEVSLRGVPESAGGLADAVGLTGGRPADGAGSGIVDRSDGRGGRGRPRDEEIALQSVSGVRDASSARRQGPTQHLRETHISQDHHSSEEQGDLKTFGNCYPQTVKTCMKHLNPLKFDII